MDNKRSNYRRNYIDDRNKEEKKISDFSSEEAMLRSYMFNEDKHVVYKKSNKINGRDYIIVISQCISNPNDQFVIIYPIFGGRNYHLRLPANTYGNIEFRSDSIIKGLKIHNERLACNLINKKINQVPKTGKSIYMRSYYKKSNRLNKSSCGNRSEIL